MGMESRGLTQQRTRKEKALASLREHQLAQVKGKLVDVDEVEATWSRIIAQFRAAVLRIPSRVALQFPDPQRAEEIVRRECEDVLRVLVKDAG